MPLNATYNAPSFGYDLYELPYDGEFEPGKAEPRLRPEAAMTTRERSTPQMTVRDR